jgi:tetratricopeptide (TPR) repeat protein
MRYLSFVFVFIFTVNIAAQSPAVSNLFANGAKEAGAGRYGEALKSYKTALFAAENEYLDANYRARLHYNVGVCYFRLDEFKPAKNHFKSAILLKHDYSRAHYALGMARMRLREWKDASTSFSRLVQLDPKNAEAWFDLAFVSIALNDLDTAETAFARSIAFGSVDSALSHNNIGVILALKGDLTAAEREFETAIEMSGSRLHEAKNNLEFCRANRLGKPVLIAKEELRFAVRDVHVG